MNLTKTQFNRPSSPLAPRVGVDIGRVLIGAADPDGAADTSFLSNTDEGALATPPVPGSLEALAWLVDACEGRVWLVSKCGPRIQQRSRLWLAHNDVYSKTGLDPGNLRFCRKRSGKAPHCAELGITHFVDDRVDVHRHLRGQVPFLFLFGHQKPKARIPHWLEHVVDWSEAAEALEAAGVPA